MSTKILASKDVAERFLQVMKMAGISQGEFAQQLGMTSGAITQIKKGESPITGPTQRLLEVIYGVNPHWLETGEGEMLRHGPGPAPEAEEDIPEICEKQLALLAQSMPNEQASARINQLAHDYRQSLIKLGFLSAATRAPDMEGKGIDFEAPMFEAAHGKVADLLTLAADILTSGNQFAVDALARNIRYFAQARRFDEEKKREKGKIQSYGGISVAELLNAYHRSHPVMDTTAKSDFYRIDRLLAPSLGHIEAESLTTQHLNTYVERRLKDGIKRRSVARELSILKAAYTWAESQDPPIIARNPTARFAVPKSRQSETPAPPSVEEVKRILAHCPRHVIRGLLLEYLLGVRPGREANGIRWSDVDLQANEIRVVSARKGGPVIRYVPIHVDLLNLLPGWMEEDLAAIGKKALKVDLGSITIVNYGLATVGSIKTAWKTAKEKAGVARRIRLYDFRHAWFTAAIKAGGDLKAISETGGHSRVDTTMTVYHHVTREDHHEAIRKMPGIPGLKLVSSPTTNRTTKKKQNNPKN